MSRATRQRLEIAVDDDDLAALYEGWVDRGFTSVKVKGGLDLDRDRARLAMIRDLFTANTSRPALMFDSNESWNRKQAIRYISALETEFDLTWVEEPLRRWDAEGLAIVSRAVRAGIATGENLTGLEQYKPLLDASAVDIVQTNAAWGITNFLRVATVAHSRDLPISPVGYCFPVAHAAATVPNHLSTEIQDLGNPYGLSLDQEIADGGLILGDEPGIGISVDEAAIAAAEARPTWSNPAGPHVRPHRAGLRLVAEDQDRSARGQRRDAVTALDQLRAMVALPVVVADDPACGYSVAGGPDRRRTARRRGDAADPSRAGRHPGAGRARRHPRRRRHGAQPGPGGPGGRRGCDVHRLAWSEPRRRRTMPRAGRAAAAGCSHGH